MTLKLSVSWKEVNELKSLRGGTTVFLFQQDSALFLNIMQKWFQHNPILVLYLPRIIPDIKKSMKPFLKLFIHKTFSTMRVPCLVLGVIQPAGNCHAGNCYVLYQTFTLWMLNIYHWGTWKWIFLLHSLPSFFLLDNGIHKWKNSLNVTVKNQNLGKYFKQKKSERL